ncbi:MAG: polyprenol monophosphomannose synthase [Candidatus Woesearchaeota archaeon]|nr:polyprenol monophosphomannose synthase [Candidatus Woesearchaeota archaeon]
MQKEDISIIIPTYNERENIGILIDKIRKYIKADILVVDDNSPDGTAIVAKKKKVRVLMNKEKKGLGYAYLKGMENCRSKVFIQMDADLSHDPKDLRRFIEKIEENDMVLGSRYIKGGSIPKDWPLHRRFISIYGNRFISLFLGKQSDWSTGYRAIRREVYEKVKDDIKDFHGYTYQIAFLNEARKNHFKISEIPIAFKDRTRGKSKLGKEYLINTIKYILKEKIKKKSTV